jgi:GNAT superfamily N-acetyltransferase
MTVYLSETISFQRERAQDCFDEARPLLQAHWAEIAHYTDIAFDPDWAAYITAEDAGFLRTYSIRERGALKGYAVFFVRTNVHYKSCLHAQCDIIYLDPALRGGLLGGRFLLWCDEQLKKEGVQMVSHHIKVAHDWGPLIKRFGYEHVDSVWYRRLDRED